MAFTWTFEASIKVMSEHVNVITKAKLQTWCFPIVGSFVNETLKESGFFGQQSSAWLSTQRLTCETDS